MIQRNVRIGERAGGAHGAHEAGAVEAGHLVVDQDDVGRIGADGVEGGMAVADLVDGLDADDLQEGAKNLAAVVLVIDDEYLFRAEDFGHTLVRRQHRPPPPIGFLNRFDKHLIRCDLRRCCADR